VKRGLKNALFAQEKVVEIGSRRESSDQAAAKNTSSAFHYSVTCEMRQLPPHYLQQHLWLSFPTLRGIEYAREFDASWVQDASKSS
jgi:hypothetical protein